MENHKKKTLLISNGLALACDIVKKAKEKNIYTIVTDWYENSPAKKISDESFMISTADIDAMVDLAKNKKVDGVITSFIDSNLENTRRVCEILGCHFYATKEQLEITMNKRKFKALCKNNHVSVVPEYVINGTLTKEKIMGIEYPVIVKPADSSGSKGITICNNEDELLSGYNKALEFSGSKEVVIEKFMDLSKSGINLDYVIIDGEVYLSSVGDLYTYQNHKSLPPLTAGVYYPSIHTDEYINKMDKNVRKMFKNLGLKNGVLYIQSFYEDGNFYFYEMGYRLGGGQSYQVISRINGVNHLEMLIDYSLTGKMCTEEVISKITPKFNKKGFILFLHIKPGVISRIEGMDKIHRLKDVVNIMQTYVEGDRIQESAANTTAQVFGKVHLVSENKESLIKTINTIKEELKIINKDGESMLIDSFNANLLET
jgi:biotin carboxylase